LIDLHCHILPALDDGPQDIAESLAMARAAVARGVSAMAASPHVMETQAGALTRERIEQALARFRERLRAEAIPLEVHLGAEYLLSCDFPHLAERLWPLASLAGGRCVLVEIPMSYIPPYLEYSSLRPGLNNPDVEKEIPKLQPVLAHPERYAEVVRDHKKARRFVEIGYLLQVNLGSLAGRYGRAVRKTAEKLIQEGLVSFAATDAHSAEALGEVMDDGVKRLRKVAGEKLAELLLQGNPERVLAGKAVESPEDYL